MHPLASRMYGLTLALGLVLACAHPVDAQKTLEGTWTATKGERDGKAADDVIGHRRSFASDRFQIQSKDAKSVYAGSFRVDVSANPAAIDFDHSEGGLKGKAWKGIYTLDGDTLIICDNAEDLDKARPAAFEAKNGSGYILSRSSAALDCVAFHHWCAAGRDGDTDRLTARSSPKTVRE